MFSSFQLNGLQTLGENIADNGAIKQAFEVGYIKDMENRHQKQIHFLFPHNSWCQKVQSSLPWLQRKWYTWVFDELRMP